MCKIRAIVVHAKRSYIFFLKKKRKNSRNVFIRDLKKELSWNCGISWKRVFRFREFKNPGSQYALLAQLPTFPYSAIATKNIYTLYTCIYIYRKSRSSISCRFLPRSVVAYVILGVAASRVVVERVSASKQESVTPHQLELIQNVCRFLKTRKLLARELERSSRAEPINTLWILWIRRGLLESAKSLKC